MRDQLLRQGITFKAVDALTEEERKSDYLVANAGRPVTTGTQAECFANDFIGLHVKSLAGGQTYADVSATQMALRPRVAPAQASGNPALPDVQKELAEVKRQADTLFKAESLRGMLLTSFGFSVLGEKGAQAATVAFGAAGLIALLSIGTLVVVQARPGRRRRPHRPRGAWLPRAVHQQRRAVRRTGPAPSHRKGALAWPDSIHERSWPGRPRSTA